MNNVPTQSAGSSGVVASDWNTYVRDNFDAIKSGHVVCTSSTRPTGVDEGTMIYESDTQKVLIYNAGWVEIHDLDNTGAAPAAMVPFLAPVGSIMQFAAASEPSGWAFCTGQELAIGSSGSTYYNLSQALGTTYGALTNGSGGAGSTHFRVPNLSGRVPVGAGTGAQDGGSGSGVISGGTTWSETLGTWRGKREHLLTSAESGLPAHKHSVTNFNTVDGAGNHTHTINADQNNTPRASGGSDVNKWFDSGASRSTNGAGAHNHNIPDHNTNDVTAANAANAHNNTQPLLVLNYIIKY
jgi:microcystin-dependent protein